MKNRFIAFIVLSFLGLLTVNAQQEPQYTQYMYNTMVYNPAYAGSKGLFSIEALYRTQWVGLDGAPDTGTISFNTPVGATEKVGLGVSIIHDKIGPSQETYFDASFSYTINTSETGKLAFGIKGGVHLLNVDFNKLSAFNPNDAFLQNNANRFSPNIGVGVYYHTPEFYLGVSAPNLVKTDHFDGDASNGVSYVAEERINYYLMTGYVFDLSENTKLKPAALLKAVDGAPLQLDVSANFLFSEKFMLGVAWRWSAAVSGLAGFQVSDNLMIGYAYDADTTGLGNFNSGSHEIFLRYEIFRNGKILSPRFF